METTISTDLKDFERNIVSYKFAFITPKKKSLLIITQ